MKRGCQRRINAAPFTPASSPFTALSCCCQNGRVSAELSLLGGLVLGSRGPDGVLTRPPGRGGA